MVVGKIIKEWCIGNLVVIIIVFCEVDVGVNVEEGSIEFIVR